MRYQTIEVDPIAGAMGAEIGGVDLSQALDNQTFAEIYQAFLDYQLIIFRDQVLTPTQQAAFGRRFGKLNVYPFVQGFEEQPEVFAIVKDKHEERNFGDIWHSDTTYLENPPLGTMLCAKEVPAAGGDTLLANTYLAYETLSDSMKALLDGLVAVNSAGLPRAGGRAERLKQMNSEMKAANIDKAQMQAEHPAIRTHPETGRKAIYVNGAHTARFKGMTEEESRPILSYLFEHAVRPEFTCRLRWRVGTLALWDNRCTQHFAVNDYQGERRVMHRLTIEGDRPR
jgi:taurine dioxygenase